MIIIIAKLSKKVEVDYLHMYVCTLFTNYRFKIIVAQSAIKIIIRHKEPVTIQFYLFLVLSVLLKRKELNFKRKYNL